MKVKTTRGFGKVTDPRTGDELSVEEPFETDRETFEALAERYPGFVIVEEDEPPPTCGYNGCSRTVDSPEDHCWQHPPDE
jgi:hypothetical protein